MVWEWGCKKGPNYTRQDRLELQNANKDITAENRALENLQKIEYKGKVFVCEQKFGDYHKLSKEMDNYQHVFISALGLVSGVAVKEMLF